MITIANKDIANRNFMATCGSRVICQPCDLRMIVVSTIPDNALLRKLRVLHLTKFGIFPSLTRIEFCLADARQQSKTMQWIKSRNCNIIDGK